MPHTFQNLRQYADKLRKFKQSRSYDHVDRLHLFSLSAPKELEDGSCQGLAVAWLAEMLADGNKHFGALTDPDIHKKNRATVVHGAKVQLVYQRGTTAEMFRKVGLRERLGDHPAPTIGISVAEAILGEVNNLPPGCGLVAGFFYDRQNKEPVGHAIAVFRHRDNRLFFFDPETGIYEVRDIEPFLIEWAAVHSRSYNVNLRIDWGEPWAQYLELA